MCVKSWKPYFEKEQNTIALGMSYFLNIKWLHIFEINLMHSLYENIYLLSFLIVS